MDENLICYVICFWGSHPNNGNDDCFGAMEFDSYQDAYDEYMVLTETGLKNDEGYCIQYLSLGKDVEGLNVHDVKTINIMITPNKTYDPRRVQREEDMWRNEQAREAGMLGGIQAYNDYMGY